jgi:hypothetical protein
MAFVCDMQMEFLSLHVFSITRVIAILYSSDIDYITLSTKHGDEEREMKSLMHNTSAAPSRD